MSQKKECCDFISFLERFSKGKTTTSLCEVSVETVSYFGCYAVNVDEIL